MDEAGVTRDEFIQPLLSIFTIDKETFALPKDWDTLGLVYLPAAFEEAGIDESQQPIGHGRTCVRLPWRLARTATTKASVRMLIGSCGEAIGKELVGMTLEGGWMVNLMNNEYADVEWKAVPVPAGPEGKADIIFTNGIGVNAATENPNAAAAFAIFVTGRDNQAAITETGFAYPTRPSQLDLIQNENDQAIAEGGTYDLTRVANWGPNTGRVNDAVSQALERLYLGEQDVAEAFAQAQKEAQLALDGAE